MRRDLVCALTLLGLAAGYYALARGLGQTALSDAIGPGGLPRIYAAVLAVLAVLLGIAALLARGRASPAAEAADQETARPLGFRSRRAAGALLLGVVYLSLIETIGYLFATMLAIAAMAIYQGERLSLRVGVVASFGALALYALFDLLLGVPMPTPWGG